MIGSRFAWGGAPPPAPAPGFGHRVGRALLIGLAGAAVGAVAFGLSRTDGEVLTAFLFVFALLMVPITVGAVLAALYSALLEAPPRRAATTTPAGPRQRCSICHRKLTQIGELRLCRSCDRFALERMG